ncbi:hypothetical protein KP79_PYT12799 [Mizuhopecten yessoensis]|uniref:Uncharacterized protein n=1 Tax=Mizuhopecten yessoensis TaxID=6573 RepID=A0A210PNG0_MIZYE|nr:hypothetical protein KP79_PYT12799 [Mizuhopecten yessoensis]
MENQIRSGNPKMCIGSADRRTGERVDGKTPYQNRIGMEVFYNLLCVLLTLLLRYAPSVGKIVKEKWSAAVSMFREWRSHSLRRSKSRMWMAAGDGIDV